MKPILVLGLGNPLQGDDGVGCAVVEVLGAQIVRPLADEVEVLDLGTPGVGLINFLEGREHVIIADAAQMGRSPGDIVRFTPNEISQDGSLRALSLHSADVAGALMLARTLRLALPNIVIYGVQPAFIGWRSVLSPAVQASVPRVVQAVLDEVGAKHGE